VHGVTVVTEKGRKMAESAWSEKLIGKWQERDVAGQIDELQRVYKKWSVVCVLIAGGGAGMMCSTDNPRILAFGLFVAMTGMVNVALMKTWAHVKISMLRIVWELQRGERGETLEMKQQ